MPPLWEQRQVLINENTTLIMTWFEKLTKQSQANVIRSMVRDYSLPKLRIMNAHLKEQVRRDPPPGCPEPPLDGM